jgi:hypothetical protein
MRQVDQLLCMHGKHPREKMQQFRVVYYGTKMWAKRKVNFSTVYIQYSINIDSSCAFVVSKSHEILTTKKYEVLLCNFNVWVSELVIISILKGSRSVGAPNHNVTPGDRPLGYIHTLLSKYLERQSVEVLECWSLFQLMSYATYRLIPDDTWHSFLYFGYIIYSFQGDMCHSSFYWHINNYDIIWPPQIWEIATSGDMYTWHSKASEPQRVGVLKSRND